MSSRLLNVAIAAALACLAFVAFALPASAATRTVKVWPGVVGPFATFFTVSGAETQLVSPAVSSSRRTPLAPAPLLAPDSDSPSIIAASRLWAAVTAWKSPVRCRLSRSIGTTWL